MPADNRQNKEWKLKTVLPSRKPRVFDFIIICAVILLAVFSVFMLKSGGGEADVINVVTDSEALTFSLKKDITRELHSGGFTYVFEIKDGRASVTEADCPDKICVGSRAVTSDGGSIICVPGRLYITSAVKSDADIIIP